MGKTVYTGGTFDFFHPGHINLLASCHKIANGGSVIIGLNTDEFIEEYKGYKPLFTYEERREILLACKYVSWIVPNGGDFKATYNRFLSTYAKPDFLVVGTDWCKKDYYEQMGFSQEWLDSQGITLVYVPYTKGVSTTDLKKRLTEL
jgi:glycerol-3-phosphate cytidylyltransferase